MSKRGIEIAAEVFNFMQQKRIEILMLADKPSTPDGKQDILLSRMFEVANDCIKDDFLQIISGETPCFLIRESLK